MCVNVGVVYLVSSEKLLFGGGVFDSLAETRFRLLSGVKDECG